ncbi:Uncharacterised protein [Providencia rettgeri]|uniref:Uncharacterized protein n=2 Tax=Morganellaceae TaxID=1903414 RepID=A0A379FS72_PRORE|nr:Uncharacterised protein [Providencia rettgeri]
MSLQIICDFYNRDIANNIALKMEYIWNKDANHDPFSKVII